MLEVGARVIVEVLFVVVVVVVVVEVVVVVVYLYCLQFLEMYMITEQDKVNKYIQ